MFQLQKNLIFVLFNFLILLPFSLFISIWAQFFIFEIYLLFGFLALLLYVLIFRLNSHIKLNVWYFTLLYLIGAFFILLIDLNLTQQTFGIQQLQPNIFFKLIFTFLTFLSIYSIKDIYLNNIRSVDYLFYIIFIYLGSCGLVSFDDFIMIFLSLEILSLASYILVAYDRKSIAASESGIKYLVLGGISTIFFLFGVALIYFYLGILDLNMYTKFLYTLETDAYSNIFVIANLFIITSLLFKLGAAPFHFWLADIYEGAPANVGFFLAIVPKLSIFLLLVKFFNSFGIDYNYIIIIIYLSLLLGSFLALSQRKTKRFIAYSSVSHIGFALLPVVSGIDTFVNYTYTYFFHYILISFLIWFFILVFFNAQQKQVRNILELSSLFFIRPVLSFLFAFVILSLAGIPPFLGFWAKFWAIFSITKINAYFLVATVLVTSFIAIQYYIRLLKLVFYEDSTLVFFGSVSKISYFTLSFLLCLLFFYSLAPFVYMEHIELLNLFKGFYSSNKYVDDYQFIITSITSVDSLKQITLFIDNTCSLQEVFKIGFIKAGEMQGFSTAVANMYYEHSSTHVLERHWVWKHFFDYLLTQNYDKSDSCYIGLFESMIQIICDLQKINQTVDVLNSDIILKSINKYASVDDLKKFIINFNSLFDFISFTLKNYKNLYNSELFGLNYDILDILIKFLKK